MLVGLNFLLREQAIGDAAMDLETLANLGEFLGGGAIIISLAYLIVGIRQNTVQLKETAKLQKLSEMRASYEQHDRYREALLKRDIAELMVKIIGGEEVDAADQLRFEVFCVQVTYSLQHQWDCVQAGVVEAEEFERLKPFIMAFFSATPMHQNWWANNKSVMKPGFVKEIENTLANAVPAPTGATTSLRPSQDS